MKHGKTLMELAAELQRQNEAKRDFLVDTRQLVMTPGLGLRLPQPGDFLNLDINDVAHRQIGQKTGIPAKYYDRMRGENRELLATNVNAWFQQDPAMRMIRTLDGTARAMLSDRFRRIDNYQIAEAVLPLIGEMQGATVESCEVTDERMYLKVVNPRIETEIVPGDVVQSGIVISNSEVGLGSVSVMPLIYRLVCSNGMIAADNGMRRAHIGRLNEADENHGIYQSATIEADDKAFVMKLQDIVRATAELAQFERMVSAMKTARDAKITSPDVPQVVELAAKDFGILQAESTGVLDHLIRGEELSLYGLANAVTRHAQDVASYDRSSVLEATAWNMLNMSRAQWNKFNAA